MRSHQNPHPQGSGPGVGGISHQGVLPRPALSSEGTELSIGLPSPALGR